MCEERREERNSWVVWSGGFRSWARTEERKMEMSEEWKRGWRGGY